MGKNGGILEEWLKNIGLLIFMQSFHAIFLAFVMEMISAVLIDPVTGNYYTFTAENFGSGETKVAIITLVAMMALLKMEKMVKGILGIKESKFGGSIGENFAKGMAGIKSAGALAARTAEPAKRTVKLWKDKARNDASLIDARKNVGDKEKSLEERRKEAREKSLELARITASRPGAGATAEEREEYNYKLKQARDAANEAQDKVKKAKEDVRTAKKDVIAKEHKSENLQTQIDHSAVQTFTTIGSSVAAGAFGVGASETIAGAAIIANPTDKLLDSIVDPHVKNTMYGKAAVGKQQQIQHLQDRLDDDAGLTSEATERVRTANPGLAEGSSEFVAKVKAEKNDLIKEIKDAIDEASKSKLDLDLELPTSKLRQIGKVMGDSWSEAATAFSADSRAGRGYARNVRNNGINYKGSNIPNIDDI